MTRPVLLVAAGIVTAFLSPVARPAVAGPPTVSSHDPAVLVRRVHWPVTIEPRRSAPDAERICAGLGPDQIRVREDGVPQDVVAVGLRPLPRLYVLLIDTSSSMKDNLVRAKGAAMSFLKALPPDDAAIVAGFDDDLVLGTGWTDDKGTLRRAVQDLTLGQHTALWDALHWLLLYLEDRPDTERVLVLVSDGEDSISLPDHTFESTLEQARDVPDLVVFPIGLGLAAAARHDSFAASSQLRQLARATGGEYFDIDRVSHLSAVFDAVQQRLDSRRYVSYIPREAEPDRGDASGDGATRGRRVEIDALDDVPCKVRSLGPERRVARDEVAPSGRLTVLPGGPVSSTVAAIRRECPDLAPPDTAIEILGWDGADDAAPEGPGPSRIYVTADASRLFGSTRDLLVARGPLFRRKSRGSGQHWRVVLVGEPAFVDRGFVVETPPLEFVQERLTDAASVLEFMLERGDCPPVGSDDGVSRPAAGFVDGGTFLELREFVGRALFRTRDDYRAWAERVTAERIDARIPELIEGLTGATAAEPGAVAALREGLLLRETLDPAGHAPLQLVEWLADVPARTAAADLERLAVNKLLSSADPGGEAGTAQTVEEGWSTIRAWLAPATGSRVVAPLVPAYDPLHGRMGFYRFTLPRPRYSVRVPRSVPGSPWAVRTVRWLLDDGDVRAVLAGKTAVRALRYEPVARRSLRRLKCVFGTNEIPEGGAGRPVALTLDLAPEGDATADPLVLTALFSEPPEGTETDTPRSPFCVTLGSPGKPASWAETAARVEEALGRESPAD